MKQEVPSAPTFLQNLDKLVASTGKDRYGLSSYGFASLTISVHLFPS